MNHPPTFSACLSLTLRPVGVTADGLGGVLRTAGVCAWGWVAIGFHRWARRCGERRRAGGHTAQDLRGRRGGWSGVAHADGTDGPPEGAAAGVWHHPHIITILASKSSSALASSAVRRDSAVTTCICSAAPAVARAAKCVVWWMMGCLLDIQVDSGPAGQRKFAGIMDGFRQIYREGAMSEMRHGGKTEEKSWEKIHRGEYRQVSLRVALWLPSRRTVPAALTEGRVCACVHLSASLPFRFSPQPWRRRFAGIMNFFRGNGANCIKIAPESALKFAAYDQFKRLVCVDPSNVQVPISQAIQLAQPQRTALLRGSEGS
jgi:hypothetical protein